MRGRCRVLAYDTPHLVDSWRRAYIALSDAADILDAMTARIEETDDAFDEEGNLICMDATYA